MNKIIFYYQTFTTLKPIIDKKLVTHIHLSAIHFGLNKDGLPYVHLNDNDPSDKCFDELWDEINMCQKNGIKIILMIGGAGGAYSYLFNNFDTYYNLLLNTIQKYKLDGIDLDIEESVKLLDVQNLIKKINNDLGNDFIISMAPIQSSIESDDPGMSGFIYKDLYKSNVGHLINYFNIQCYDSFTFESYQNMINNNYPIDKLVMGMIYSQSLDQCITEIQKIINHYHNIGGVFIWEYCFADNNKPLSWANSIYQILYPKYCLIQ